MSTPTIFSPHPSSSNTGEESKEDRAAAAKSSRLAAKKNTEAAQNFITNVTQFCISRDARLEELNNCWENQFQLLINQAVHELQNAQHHINEKTIRQAANL